LIERTVAAGSAWITPVGCTDPKSQYTAELTDDCLKQLLELKVTLWGAEEKLCGAMEVVASFASDQWVLVVASFPSPLGDWLSNCNEHHEGNVTLEWFSFDGIDTPFITRYRPAPLQVSGVETAVIRPHKVESGGTASLFSVKYTLMERTLAAGLAVIFSTACKDPKSRYTAASGEVWLWHVSFLSPTAMESTSVFSFNALLAVSRKKAFHLHAWRFMG